MPITLNLKQLNPMTTFTVTIDQNATIRKLKESICEINSVPVDAQRVIFAGQILKDENTIDSYGIKDGFTLHFVKSKQKTVPATPASPSATPATTGAHATPSPQHGGGSAGTQQAQPGISTSASPSGSGLSRIPGLGSIDPSTFETMLSDPALRQFISSPNFGSMLNGMIRSNPQFKQLMEQHPEISSTLENPETIRHLQDAMSSPEAFRDFMRHLDTMMNRFENTPELFTELEHTNEVFMDAFRKRATSSEPPPPPNTTTDPNKNTDDVFGSEDHHTPDNINSNANPIPGLPNLGSMNFPFGNFGGMNGNFNQQMMSLLSNPEIQRQCQEMLKNPQMVELLCQSHPEMRSFIPLLQNPEFMKNMFNPQMLEMMSRFSQPFGGSNGDAFSNGTSYSAPQTAPAPFSSQELTQEQFEEAKAKFASQLEKLREMGFDDEKKCIKALIATNGSINIAIEKLMG